MTHPTGIAGRLAAAFIHSKLTPLVIIASLLLGVYAVLALPREEEPQIIVPMIDVFVEMPGASPPEVEQRVTRPIEQLLWEVPGGEERYSTSNAARAVGAGGWGREGVAGSRPGGGPGERSRRGTWISGGGRPIPPRRRVA